MEKRPNAFALSYGGELDRGRAWRAGYALIDPDKEPTDGELCVFGSLEDAKMLPWPGKDGEGGRSSALWQAFWMWSRQGREQVRFRS